MFPPVVLIAVFFSKSVPKGADTTAGRTRKRSGRGHGCWEDQEALGSWIQPLGGPGSAPAADTAAGRARKRSGRGYSRWQGQEALRPLSHSTAVLVRLRCVVPGGVVDDGVGVLHDTLQLRVGSWEVNRLAYFLLTVLRRISHLDSTCQGKTVVYYSASDGAAEYCLSVSVCLCVFVLDYIFGTARPIFTKFLVCVSYGRRSVLLRRPSDMLRTLGLKVFLIFLSNGIHLWVSEWVSAWICIAHNC